MRNRIIYCCLFAMALACGKAENPLKGKSRHEINRYLRDAVERKDLSLLKLVMEAGIDTKSNGVKRIFINLVRDGEVELAEKFLQAGVDANLTYKKRYTALMYCLNNQDRNMLELLLRYKLDIDKKNFNEETEFMRMVDKGNRKMVQLLIEKKADVNFQTKWGLTPLMVAAKQGDKELVEILLKAGANKELTDHYRKTAYRLAKERGHEKILDLLRPPGEK